MSMDGEMVETTGIEDEDEGEGEGEGEGKDEDEDEDSSGSEPSEECELPVERML